MSEARSPLVFHKTKRTNMAMNCETVIGLIVYIIVFIMGIVALSIASGTHSTRNVSKKKKKHFKYFKCLRKRRPYFGTRKAIATKSYGVKYIFLIYLYVFNFSPECAPLSSNTADFQADIQPPSSHTVYTSLDPSSDALFVSIFECPSWICSSYTFNDDVFTSITTSANRLSPTVYPVLSDALFVSMPLPTLASYPIRNPRHEASLSYASYASIQGLQQRSSRHVHTSLYDAPVASFVASSDSHPISVSNQANPKPNENRNANLITSKLYRQVLALGVYLWVFVGSLLISIAMTERISNATKVSKFHRSKTTKRRGMWHDLYNMLYSSCVALIWIAMPFNPYIYIQIWQCNNYVVCGICTIILIMSLRWII
eukprot:599591_1